MKMILHYFLLLVILIGCKEQTNQPSSLTPYEKWRSFNIDSYTIEQVPTCFCADGGVKMKLTIHSDSVYSVMNLSDSTVVPTQVAKQYLSIDSLFGIIRNSKTDSLVFTHNALYGYPEKLDINPQQHPVDGGALYETSRLEPIQF